MVLTHTKRPFSDDESYQLAFKKQHRQVGYSDQTSAFVEIVPCNNASQKICYPDEERFSKAQLKDTNPSSVILDPPVKSNQQLGYSEASVIPRTAFVDASWDPVAYNRKDDDVSDSAVQVSCSLVLHEYQRDIYSSLTDYPPQRFVPIGPDYQAAIPACCPREATTYSTMVDDSDVGLVFSPKFYLVDNEEDMKFQGTCVIPMPDSVSCADWKGKFGHGRIDCGCKDHGSIRCVRQHVLEGREQLKIELGEERFMQLGFCEMGEEVAEKWSTEEEVFHEMVCSNPSSLGRNFWDQLSIVFPSRTKKELVSYYFNVFVLRRRAEQNRWDPFNADSDDDEWQLSDSEEPAVTEEDEDSAVDDHDSVDQDGSRYGIFYVDEDCHDDDDDDDDDEDYHDDDDDDDGGVDVPREHNKSIDRSCNMDPTSQPKENTGNSTEDQDLQNDSSVSYECHYSRDDHPCNPADVARRQSSEYSNSEYLNDSLDGLIADGYAVEPCEQKVWDPGFVTDPLKEIDFLSTCNMIKEVFGEEAWSNETLGI